MSTPTLRPATPADIPRMCRNVAEGVGSYREWAPGWEPRASLSDPRELEECWQRPGFTAHVEADVEGHVAAHWALDEADAFHLMHLFVREHRQGTGLAAALLDLAVADARAARATGLRLRTPIGNTRGIAFYEREGWQRVGEPITDSPFGLDLTWMRRAL